MVEIEEVQLRRKNCHIIAHNIKYNLFTKRNLQTFLAGD